MRQESTSNHAAMAKAKPGTGMYKVYYDTMEGNPNAFVQSEEEAKEVMLKDPKALFFGPDVVFANDNRFMALRLVDALYGVYGFGFQKGSELRDMFNYQLKKLDESGVKQKLFNKWVKGVPGADSPTSQQAIINTYRHNLPII